MIQIIDAANAYRHRSLLRSFSALRYDVFVKRLGWPIPCPQPGLEEDQFDGAQAIYLVIADCHGAAVAGARLLDTSRQSLLADVFPYLVDGPPPRDRRIFEVTRFVTAPKVNGGEADRTLSMKLLWGLQAFGARHGLSHLVSVSYLGLQPMLRRAGYCFRPLGPIREMDRSRVVALQHDVSEGTLTRVRACIDGPCALLN
ncbi:acyl-homoserine-lactone synthase [Telmatospirillum sp.]|uniref:acyl-homoserine-lactone synthase n=1 Tax=Telmatospirillum sp. TaxID=2079197 RepID=UPI0028413C0C|nr:acyl-homoserine-lactone synthase [Telmatospirillum sp.]MDR3439689.1 acyl-homoserine-lactone synthase [Telmatospirillum sp.]